MGLLAQARSLPLVRLSLACVCGVVLCHLLIDKCSKRSFLAVIRAL